jgi:hypothetical protein
MKCIRDLINGNLTDAKKSARSRSFIAIANAATDEYGMSFEESHYTAAYLKGEITWTQYCQERNAVTYA